MTDFVLLYDKDNNVVGAKIAHNDDHTAEAFCDSFNELEIKAPRRELRIYSPGILLEGHPEVE